MRRKTTYTHIESLRFKNLSGDVTMNQLILLKLVDIFSWIKKKKINENQQQQLSGTFKEEKNVWKYDKFTKEDKNFTSNTQN